MKNGKKKQLMQLTSMVSRCSNSNKIPIPTGRRLTLLSQNLSFNSQFLTKRLSRSGLAQVMPTRYSPPNSENRSNNSETLEVQLAQHQQSQIIYLLRSKRKVYHLKLHSSMSRKMPLKRILTQISL